MALETAIIKNKSIWLSSISQSNDYLEGKLISKFFHDFFYAFEENFTHPSVYKVLTDEFNFLESSFDIHAFCLSEEGDLLSQWRGYADDGRGFSIEFNLEKLSNLIKINNSTLAQDSYAIEPVSYDVAIATQMAVDIGNQAMSIYNSQGGDIEKAKLQIAALPYRQSLKHFLIKSPAFREEAEWRLFKSHLNCCDDNYNYRIGGGAIIPYTELSFSSAVDIIDEIRLGPKNSTPIKVISEFIVKNNVILREDYKGTLNIRRSDASYR